MLLRKLKVLLILLLFVIPSTFLTVLVILPACTLHMCFVLCLARIFRPDLHAIFQGMHGLFATKTSQNVIITVIWDGHRDIQEGEREFRTKVLDYRKSPGGPLVYEKLQAFWTHFGGYAFWKMEADFNLQEHVRLYDYEGDLALEMGTFSDEDHDRILSGLVHQPWKKEKSPWEVLYFPFMSKNSPKTFVLLRADHVLGDFFSGVDMAKRFTGAEFRMPNIKMSDRSLAALSFWEKASLPFRLQWDAADELCMVLETETIVSWSRLLFSRRKVLGGKAIVSSGPVINVDIIKRIKNHFRVHFGAVLYAGILGAINKAMRAAGLEPPGSIIVMFVLPFPGHPGGLNIHSTGAIGLFPVKCDSPVERLFRIQKSFEAMTRSTVPLHGMILSKVGTCLPLPLMGLIGNFVSAYGSLAATNLPVTAQPDYYAGHEILEISGAVGPFRSINFLVGAGGVNNKLRIVFLTQESIFSSPEVGRNVGRYLNGEFQELHRAVVAEGGH